MKSFLIKFANIFLDNELTVYKYLFMIGAILNYGKDSFWTMLGFSVVFGYLSRGKHDARS